MKFTKAIYTLALAFILCIGGATAQELRFNSNHKFKIVQFTDVHWIYDDPKSEEAAERMREVLDAERPDLVVYTGDIIFAKPAAPALQRALEPAIERGIPFAVTWGNHDDEQDLTRKQLLELVQGFKGNLSSTTEGIKGVTNYTLQIQSAKSEAAAAVLYVFDSNSYSPNKRAKGYEWIAHNQIGWYIQQSAAYTSANEGNPLPALAFFHIPLPEFNEAVKTENSFMIGTRKEPACSPKINSGLAAAMLEAGDVMGVFVGHDHVNDYAVSWKGIMLCYGRFTGGPTVYHHIPGGNGARIIELTEGERQFRSWIRLEGGQVINDFTYPSKWIK